MDHTKRPFQDTDGNNFNWQANTSYLRFIRLTQKAKITALRGQLWKHFHALLLRTESLVFSPNASSSWVLAAEEFLISEYFVSVSLCFPGTHTILEMAATHGFFLKPLGPDVLWNLHFQILKSSYNIFRNLVKFLRNNCSLVNPISVILSWMRLWGNSFQREMPQVAPPY